MVPRALFPLTIALVWVSQGRRWFGRMQKQRIKGTPQDVVGTPQDEADNPDGYHKDRQDNRRMRWWTPRDEAEWYGLPLFRMKGTSPEAKGMASG